MNKKVILLMSLMLLVGFAVFVFAEELRIPIQKGWNLVYGLNGAKTPTDILSGSEIQSQNIKAIYVYLPQINNYGRVHPNPEVDKILQYLTVDEVENSVFWVYSDKSGNAKFNVDTPIYQFDQRVLNQGWNFVGITADMIPGPQDTNLKDIKGNCNIEKSYFWIAETQKWEKAPIEYAQLEERSLGSGWIIKVSNNCRLGKSGGEVPSVPNLP